MCAAKSAASRIFISYRRDDAAYPAGWLFDRLVDQFGADQVFKDVDSIGLGHDFAKEIQGAVQACSILLAVIGIRWLTVTGPGGRRRLDSPDDFVRLEIEGALEHGVQIIPVLVDGARMPNAAELPASLQPLSHRNALELSPSRFGSDFGKLLSALDDTLATRPVDRRAPNARAAQRARAGFSLPDRISREAWPNPDAIGTMEEYVAALHRTWIRAGAQSHDQISRLTGGLVREYQVSSLLGSYNKYHTWDKDDFENVLLILDALQVPDKVVAKWRKAGPRAKRGEYVVRWWWTMTGLALYALIIPSAVGLAFSVISAKPKFGTGDWPAFAASCLVLAVVTVSLVGFSYDGIYRSSPRAANSLVWFYALICVAAFGCGWLDLNHLHLVSQITKVTRTGTNVRNWMVWRF